MLRTLRPAAGRALLLGALLAAGCAPVQPPHARVAAVGPERGSLVIAGGGRLGPEIVGRFLELAGGPDARIVVIPTAGGDPHYPADWEGLDLLRRAGARNLSLLHSYDRAEADTEEFARPLREAGGVWISGGRQWRLADSYLQTRTLREIRGVLDRGGVVGGTSAGASIMGSYLVRGAPEGNHILMSPGHEEGFAFLRDTGIDQHLLARNRQDDLLELLAVRPELLGIGIDEGTAVVVRGDRMEVVGRSRVAVYDGRRSDDGSGYFFLDGGAVYDLRSREVVREGAR